jgi:phospholipid transport system substrate-binding protein
VSTGKFSIRNFRRAALFAAVVAIAAAAPRAANAADTAMIVVQGTVNQAMTVLRDRTQPLPQRQTQLRAIVAQTFDFSEMSRSALGYHWRSISPDQQAEFTQAFVAFIEDSYLSKLNDYRGQQVVFTREQSLGAGYAQVNSQIVSADGKDPIKLDFLCEQKDTTWKIYDVTVDAISIIANYRNQFNRVMNSKGYATLISDLKAKQAALAASLANH